MRISANIAKVESRDKIHCDYAEVYMYLGANEIKRRP